MKLDLTKRYGEKSVLDGFRLEIAPGKITCILGQSGCGKTTILQCIAGLVPFEGTVEGRPAEISYVFQRERLLENLTVYGNLAYVLAGRRLPDERERILHALEQVELSEVRDSLPKTLSGGMAQRVSIARGFVYPSELLLMDEPFQALDMALKHRVMRQFLKAWSEDRRTTVFVTHSIDEALMLADRIVLLTKGAEILAEFSLASPQAERRLSDETLGGIRKQIFETLGI